MPRVDQNSPLEDRINYVLYNEVNPALAAHGGEVSLVEVTEDMYAILRFGGGCQGCSAVDQTRNWQVCVTRPTTRTVPKLTTERLRAGPAATVFNLPASPAAHP